MVIPLVQPFGIRVHPLAPTITRKIEVYLIDHTTHVTLQGTHPIHRDLVASPHAIGINQRPLHIEEK